jgi:hypothetical protein
LSWRSRWGSRARPSGWGGQGHVVPGMASVGLGRPTDRPEGARATAERTLAATRRADRARHPWALDRSVWQPQRAAGENARSAERPTAHRSPLTECRVIASGAHMCPAPGGVRPSRYVDAHGRTGWTLVTDHGGRRLLPASWPPTCGRWLVERADDQADEACPRGRPRGRSSGHLGHVATGRGDHDRSGDRRHHDRTGGHDRTRDHGRHGRTADTRGCSPADRRV